MNIAIVDDHLMIIHSVSNLLATKGIRTVFYSLNGLEMIKSFKSLKEEDFPDIILVDINMPQMDGFESVKWLKENYPNLKIIVLTMSDNSRDIYRMIKLGVNSYVNKSTTTPDKLFEIIDIVYKDGEYYSTNVVKVMAQSIQNLDGVLNIDIILESITVVEKDIIKLICLELTSSEISEKLNINLRTLEGYVKEICLKMGVKSRVGIAVFAQKYGLLN